MSKHTIVEQLEDAEGFYLQGSRFKNMQCLNMSMAGFIEDEDNTDWDFCFDDPKLIPWLEDLGFTRMNIAELYKSCGTIDVYAHKEANCQACFKKNAKLYMLWFESIHPCCFEERYWKGKYEKDSDKWHTARENFRTDLRTFMELIEKLREEGVIDFV